VSWLPSAAFVHRIVTKSKEDEEEDSRLKALITCVLIGHCFSKT
jgi:hypothetical protein